MAVLSNYKSNRTKIEGYSWIVDANQEIDYHDDVVKHYAEHGDCKSPSVCFGIANPEERGRGTKVILTI